jgi:hypothetical protein
MTVQAMLTCEKGHGSVSRCETDVTGPRGAAYHRTVRYRTEQLLTKRRAVDFCRVSAALCRQA